MPTPLKDDGGVDVELAPARSVQRPSAAEWSSASSFAEPPLNYAQTEDFHDPARPSPSAWMWNSLWVLLSGCLAFMNKSLLALSPFPIALAAMHMLVTACGVVLLRLAPGYSQQLPSISKTVWLRAILPLALLQSTALVLSNIAYVRGPISLIQMLNSALPMLLAGFQVTRGWKGSNLILLAATSLSCLGCSILAVPEIQSNSIVIVAALGALIIKASQCILLSQTLTVHGLSTLQALFWSMLTGGVLLILLACIVEGTGSVKRILDFTGPLITASSVAAFGLNTVAAILIDTARDRVTTFATVGLVKEALVIVVSVTIEGISVSLWQCGGWLLMVLAGSILRFHDMPAFMRSFRNLGGSGASGNATSSPYRIFFAGALMASVLLTLLLRFPTHGFKESSPDILRSVQYDLDYSKLSKPSSDSKGLMKYVHNGKGADMFPAFDNSVDVSKLPRLAWVVTATPAAIEKDGPQLANLACYAERLGIPFFIEHHLMNSERMLIVARHRGLAKHLRYYQWVFSTDSDLIVGDSTFDVRTFLDDAVDVIFNDRDNREICACAFFTRNSPGGWSFLRRWWSWGDHGDHMNGDNGDLLEMLPAALTPAWPNNKNFTGRYHGDDAAPILEGYDACRNGEGDDWTSYNKLAFDCAPRILAPHRAADDSSPYWDVKLWSWTDVLPSIAFRSYKAFAGFQRQLEGTLEVDFGYWFYNYEWPTYSLNGVPGDFMFHGKNLGLYVTPDSLFCTGKEWRYPDKQWSVEHTRKEFSPSRYNFTWWPGCFDEGGINRCLD